MKPMSKTLVFLAVLIFSAIVATVGVDRVKSGDGT